MAKIIGNLTRAKIVAFIYIILQWYRGSTNQVADIEDYPIFGQTPIFFNHCSGPSGSVSSSPAEQTAAEAVSAGAEHSANSWAVCCSV